MTQWSGRTLSQRLLGSRGTFESVDLFRRRRGCYVTRFPLRVGFFPGKMATVTAGKRKKWPWCMEFGHHTGPQRRLNQQLSICGGKFRGECLVEDWVGSSRRAETQNCGVVHWKQATNCIAIVSLWQNIVVYTLFVSYRREYISIVY